MLHAISRALSGERVGQETAAPNPQRAQDIDVFLSSVGLRPAGPRIKAQFLDILGAELAEEHPGNRLDVLRGVAASLAEAAAGTDLGTDVPQEFDENVLVSIAAAAWGKIPPH